MHARLLVLGLSVVALASPGCSSDPGGGPDHDAGRGDAFVPGTDAFVPGTDTGTPHDTGTTPDTGPMHHDAGPLPMGRDVRCGDPAPTGAAHPSALHAYSMGTCPTLVPGVNSFMTAGNTRSFILVTPTDMRPDEHLPVLFMWHWLGGSADGFLDRGNVQAAADALRIIAVIPEKKGDVTIDVIVREIDMAWPYLTSSSDARVDEELTFFDDMLACVAEQFAPDLDCVSSVGVSAGALWTSQLMQRRSDYLASAIVLSGGVGPASGTTFLDVRGWSDPPPPHAMPALVLWGGPTDTCAINFERASHNLEGALVDDDAFLVECIHNCGHDVPPVEDPTLGVAALYQFAVDHPFWLDPRESPYTTRGFPPGMPTWCSIGAGAATPRTGMCDPGGPACDFPSL